jgi:membrane protein YqaA with SNARE-associated domain
MDMLYQWILQEAFVAAAVPGRGEVVLQAMRCFGGYTMALPVLLAMAGAGAGSLLIWGMGWLLQWARRLHPQTVPQDVYEALSRYTRRVGWLVLPFYVFVPLGGLALVAAGFLRMPAWAVFLAAAAGRGLLFQWQGV